VQRFIGRPKNTELIFVENKWKKFAETLKSALQLDYPYVDRVQTDWSEKLGDKAKPSAVLVVFAYGKQDSFLEPWVLFTKRTETVATHKGQISFPGGRCEPEDQGAAVSTALREAYEEVGLVSERVHVVGELPSLFTVTGYLIQPCVGVLNSPMEEVELRLNPDEITQTIWVSLSRLWHADTYRREHLRVGAVGYPIDVFQVDSHRIWGATGSLTKNLLDRLVAVSYRS